MVPHSELFIVQILAILTFPFFLLYHLNSAVSGLPRPSPLPPIPRPLIHPRPLIPHAHGTVSPTVEKQGQVQIGADPGTAA